MLRQSVAFLVLNNGSHIIFLCYGIAMKLILPRSQVCAAVEHEFIDSIEHCSSNVQHLTTKSTKNTIRTETQ